MGIYGGGYGYGGYGYGGYGYGGYPSSSVPVYPPPPTPLVTPPAPQPPVPQPFVPQQPMPQPSVPQSPTPISKRFVWFHNMTAHGVQGVTKPVVWFDDPDFNDQLNSHYNNSKLWLVDRNSTKSSCSIHPPCRLCQHAWYPYNGSNVAGFPNRTVVLYFREPVILKRVVILELASKDIQEVFLLGWPAVPIPQLGLNTTRLYDNVTQHDVFTSLIRARLDVCGRRVEAVVKPPRSDDPQRVPPQGFSQASLPPFFQERAVGGVGIRLRAPLNPSLVQTQIGQVLFSGRVLYPQNPSEYLPYPRPQQQS